MFTLFALGCKNDEQSAAFVVHFGCGLNLEFGLRLWYGVGILHIFFDVLCSCCLFGLKSALCLGRWLDG